MVLPDLIELPVTVFIASGDLRYSIRRKYSSSSSLSFFCYLIKYMHSIRLRQASVFGASLMKVCSPL